MIYAAQIFIQLRIGLINIFFSPPYVVGSYIWYVTFIIFIVTSD